MDILVDHWGFWLILIKCECYAKGYIYFHICSVNRATAYELPSISLCPTRRAALSSYWMLMMSTPAPVAADLRFGPWPSLMMVLAHRQGHNWQAKPAGICLGSAGPWLWRARLPAAIYYWTQGTSFPSHLFPHHGTLFYRLSAGLIRADMPSVLGWTDIAFAGVCVCVCLCKRKVPVAVWRHLETCSVL